MATFTVEINEASKLAGIASDAEYVQFLMDKATESCTKQYGV